MMIVTFYSLFCDDIRLMYFTKAHDYDWMYATSVAMGLFAIEIILASIGQPGYFASFFFWLDLLSTVSLITDIQPLWDIIMGHPSVKDENEERDTGELARASRGARMGSKAGRIVRVVRLIRLVRVIKLANGGDKFKKTIDKDPQAEALKALRERQIEKNKEKKVDEESKIAKELSDRITKKIVTLVLCFLFTAPLFTTTNYIEEPNSFMFGLYIVKELGVRSPIGLKVFSDIVEQQKLLDTPIIELYINLDDGKPPIVWKDYSVPLKTLRHIEKEITELRLDVPEN